MRKLVWMCMCDVDKFMNANILYICIRIYVYKSLPDPICSLFVPAVQKSCSCKKLVQTEKYVFFTVGQSVGTKIDIEDTIS